MAADEIKLTPHLMDKMLHPPADHRLRLWGPIGYGDRLFTVSLLSDVPCTVVFATNEEDAKRAFKREHGLAGVDPPLNVIEHQR